MTGDPGDDKDADGAMEWIHWLYFVLVTVSAHGVYRYPAAGAAIMMVWCKVKQHRARNPAAPAGSLHRMLIYLFAALLLGILAGMSFEALTSS